MELNIICGAIDTNKTYKCILEMKRLKKENEDEKIIYIVPEQFSHSAEKLITSHFDGMGLNNIEALTFSQMSSRYLNTNKKNYLTPSQRTVLIQKAINMACCDDNIYKNSIDKPGFLDAVSALITEFKRCMITSATLLKSVEGKEDNLYSNKIKSVAKIYEKYEELTNQDYLDSDDDLTILAQKSQQDNIFLDTVVFFDEFSDFLPQHYKMLDVILRQAKATYVTLPICEKIKDSFNIPFDTKKNLLNIAKKYNIKANIIEADKICDYFESEEIKFLYENYLKINKKGFASYDNTTNDIQIFYGKDPYSEALETAKNIRQLVDEENVKYSDIGVICGDTNDYINILKAVFNDFNIPYFSDVKQPIIEHPIVLLVFSMLDILKENWSYDSVFRYLKSGFIYKKENDEIIQISDDDVDMLDCFVLKRGIKGKKKWTGDEKWKNIKGTLSDAVNDYKKETKEDIQEEEHINKIRKEFIAPIENFSKKTAGKKKVIDYCSALFEFFGEVYLYEGIKKEIEFLNAKSLKNQAEIISKVWNILIEVLDSLVKTVGDEKCNIETFRRYIYSAFCANDISIIPFVKDCVKISSYDSARQNRLDYLFLLGAVKGKMPKDEVDSGILSDDDRNNLTEYLENQDLTIESNKLEKRKKEEYKLYKVLFTANKKINISYPLNSFEGEAIMPSDIIEDIIKIFKNVKIRNDLFNNNEGDLFFTPKLAFDYLLENRNNENDLVTKKILSWYEKSELWEEKRKILEISELYKTNKAKISPENAKLLYDALNSYSTSRLEVFSDCPFKYFAQFGLCAKPEEVWQIQKFDLGTLMHYAVCRYCEIIEDGAKDLNELKGKWHTLSDEKSDLIINDIMGEISKKVSYVLERDEAKVDYLIKRMTKIIKRSSDMIKRSIQKGEYVSVEYEKRFNIPMEYDNRSVNLRGTIDRIDILNKDDVKNQGLRVIDYKSGKKDFSVVSVSNMKDIQLLVYAYACEELYKRKDIRFADYNKNAQIKGILYNKLRDDFLLAANSSNIDEIKENTVKQMKLNGIVILDSNEGEYSVEDALLMDREILENSTSSFLNLNLKIDKTFTKQSDIMSKEDFNKLMEFIKRKIISNDKRIMSGDIEISPLKDNTTDACKYCDMAQICMFDDKKDTIRKPCTKEENAWEIINEEIKSDK